MCVILKIERGIGFDGNVAVASIIRLYDYPVKNPDCYAVQNSLTDDGVWEINKNDYMSEKDYKIAELKRQIAALEKEE
jgi:hypothetical protein